MRCPYKWLMCPPPNHALIHTTNSGSPAKFWFGIQQNMSPWYVTVNINFQVNIFSFLTDLITKGEMPRHKMFHNSHWTQNTVWIGLWNAKLNFDAMIISVYWECTSKWHEDDKRFPSLQSVNHNTHSRLLQVIIFLGAVDRTRNLRRKGNLSCKGGSRCGRESNFLTVFIELRCLSGHSVLCVFYSAILSCSFLNMMMMCKHCVLLPRLARQGVN